ncbi:heat shock 70 kDa protein 4L-like isoform X1 [Centruroides vittatus]|uniref:heat shock 70 kDa protein 4L-like isoform X1 n=1 Tax=Centruroides vittatus TaxID=120091 RepID=UPI0035103E1C
MSAIGIDFGSENCYIAVIKEGAIEVLMNEYGLRSTPNYIYFGPRNRDIGVSAKLNHVPHYGNTIHNLKNLIGGRYEEMKDEIQFLTYDLIHLPDGSIGIKVNYLHDNTIFNVQQVTAMMFTKLKEIVEYNLSIKVKDCVLSIPAFFNDNERRALIDSATIAGLNVLHLLHETTAVALFCGFYNKQFVESNKIMFIDMGHSSLQVSICNISKDVVEVLGTTWKKNLGGRNFDEILLHYFSKRFYEKHKVQVLNDRKATVRLRQECEKLKKQMSSNSLTLPINIECLIDELDLNETCNREIFENECSHLLSMIEETILRALTERKITAQDIDSIYIVGGSTRTPAIRTIIHNIFNKEPTTTLNQDETVAKGCALKCAIISPLIKTQKFDVIENCPFSITLSWKSKNLESLGDFQIFKQNQKLPSSSIVTVMSSEPFILKAYTNENIEIGTFFIEEVIPIEGNNTKVDVNVEINESGLFSIKSAYLIEEKTPEEQNKLQLTKFSTNNNNNNSVCCCKDIEQNTFFFVNQQEEENSIQEQKESKESGKDVFNQTQNNLCLLKTRSITKSLSEETLLKYKQMEETMINRDRLEKERTEAKNYFEEYIYRMKENVFNEISPQKESILSILDEATNWLENEGEDQEEGIYIEKLEQLKNYFGQL